MTSLFLASFLAGSLTVLAPCVLPVLPLVFASTLGEKKWKHVLLIIASLGLSIFVFTISLKATTLFIHIPESFWKFVSGGILIFFSITYIFPHIWTIFSQKFFQKYSTSSLEKAQEHKSPAIRSCLMGAALGPVFSTCSPTYSLLLATVFPVSFFSGILYMISYVIGLATVLVLIALFGRKLIAKMHFFSQEDGRFKKILGITLFILGFSIISGFDKKIETFLAERYDATSIEQRVLDALVPPGMSPHENKNMLQNPNSVKSSFNIESPFPAPDIPVGDWIQSQPLSMNSLKGKVVLIDFWTYSCINCQRTLPYIVEWDKKYRDKGLVIIGVHAPEFAFEKDKKNVEEAILKAGIQYPVFLDNDFQLWGKYGNRYWPAKYFIDKNGLVRHYHFGEGAYEESEKVIQELLGISEKIDTKKTVSYSSFEQTPETYLGTARRKNYLETTNLSSIPPHFWSLYCPNGGTCWKHASESIEATKSGAELVLNYSAKDVYLVVSGSGQIESFSSRGEKKTIPIQWDSLYHIVSSHSWEESGILRLRFSQGLQAFAFTFWS